MTEHAIDRCLRVLPGERFQLLAFLVTCEAGLERPNTPSPPLRPHHPFVAHSSTLPPLQPPTSHPPTTLQTHCCFGQGLKVLGVCDRGDTGRRGQVMGCGADVVAGHIGMAWSGNERTRLLLCHLIRSVAAHGAPSQKKWPAVWHIVCDLVVDTM